MYIGQPEYKKLISEIRFGKRLRTDLYLYLGSAQHFPPILRSLLDSLRAKAGAYQLQNVIKLNLTVPKVSLLYYCDFLKDPHPVLKSSMVFDLGSGEIQIRDYASSTNPPILHRKETLLSDDHPCYQEFSDLTRQEEVEGLYQTPHTIGFKKNWEELLKQKGLAYEGHSLIRIAPISGFRDQSDVRVVRHRTAIARYNLSRPVRKLLEHGILGMNSTFLDYGCGRGDDVRQLRNMGFSATSWDPVYDPSGRREESEVVNLGFVLNVIEDQYERSAVLQDAFRLSQKLLIVSAQIASSLQSTVAVPFKDGYLTRRGTFQKYYTQRELGIYIENVLQINADPVGLGIFYVFRHPADRQAFLASRYRRSLRPLDFIKEVRPPCERRVRAQKASLYEENSELLDSFWSKMLDLGRLPLESEFDHHGEILRTVGSAKKAQRLFIRRFGDEAIRRAFERKRDDLQVYLALSSFRRPPPFRDLPSDLQADIKTFLGGYAQGIAKSKELLFSAGKPEVVAKVCDGATVGYVDPQALYLHKSLLDELDPVLRVYVGCGEMLYGDVEGIDIIKIHKRSGKLSFLKYDDFEGKLLPELLERVKIDLRHLSVEAFDHRTPTPQLLFFKERYVAKDHPMREKWQEFSEWLLGTGIDLDGYGPSRQVLFSFLEGKGLKHELLEQETTEELSEQE